MAIQQINLGSIPSGAGGDTSRSANVKVNENFTNPQHAASRTVGVDNGNVMEVGAFGLRKYIGEDWTFGESTGFQQGGVNLVLGMAKSKTEKACLVLPTTSEYSPTYRSVDKNDSSKWGAYYSFYTTQNTTVDANGFVKKASPVIHVFCDRIEPNEEAQEQNPTFEKVGVGHYLIKGTEGFATQGWWIEVPTDSNGNKVCAVEYQILENGDLEIKTFKKKLNEDGDIVANLEKPMDIPRNSNGEQRWIDIRLNELPKKPVVMQVPRTEKQPKMVKRIKYAPQLTYITKMEDLIDDSGNVVKFKGRNFQNPVTHIHTDANGTPILTDQPVVSESGETVFEFVQAVDGEGNLVFEDAPVLDEDGNQIFDEVIHEP